MEVSVKEHAHQVPVDDVLRLLGTDAEKGRDILELRARQARFGPHVIPAARGPRSVDAVPAAIPHTAGVHLADGVGGVRNRGDRKIAAAAVGRTTASRKSNRNMRHKARSHD
jgi:hypothetical protein